MYYTVSCTESQGNKLCLPTKTGSVQPTLHYIKNKNSKLNTNINLKYLNIQISILKY